MLLAGILPALFALSQLGYSQQTVTAGQFTATLKTDPATLAPEKPNTLEVEIEGPAPAFVAATLTMPVMPDMRMEPPKMVRGSKPGRYGVQFQVPHVGMYRLTLYVKPRNGAVVTLGFDLSIGKTDAMDDMAGMAGMAMKGAFGPWSANREGSGTSWQPDASPMFIKMLPTLGGFELSTMGIVQAGYVVPGTKRVNAQTFTDSMVMLMGRRQTGGGTLGLDFMTSLDPVINGKEGVPDVFQTGETAYGQPLVDRQHPHNLFSELAASYSHPIGKEWDAFIYGAPVGEPALGNVMYLHRPSGMEVPEAPITHHWFDSTHISFGVATLGLVYQQKWKLEGSWFNGHEPGENRYEIGPESLNSTSGRLSYNPSKEWSFSGSYGFLDSPEAESPGVDEHRTTLSAAYSHALPHGDNLSATVYFGQNATEGNPTPSDAWLAEATLYHARESIFMRLERVDKDDLANLPAGNYEINKLVFGDVHNVLGRDGIEYGVGAYAGLYSFPSSLDAYYGKNPLTFGVFVRIRPAAMK